MRPLGIRQFQPLVEKCREIETMKNRRGNRPASGGPVRTGEQVQGNAGKGKQNQKKPYQRPSGKGTGSGQQRPQEVASGGHEQKK